MGVKCYLNTSSTNNTKIAHDLYCIQDVEITGPGFRARDCGHFVLVWCDGSGDREINATSSTFTNIMDISSLIPKSTNTTLHPQGTLYNMVYGCHSLAGSETGRVPFFALEFKYSTGMIRATMPPGFSNTAGMGNSGWWCMDPWVIPKGCGVPTSDTYQATLPKNGTPQHISTSTQELISALRETAWYCLYESTNGPYTIYVDYSHATIAQSGDTHQWILALNGLQCSWSGNISNTGSFNGKNFALSPRNKWTVVMAHSLSTGECWPQTVSISSNKLLVYGNLPSNESPIELYGSIPITSQWPTPQNGYSNPGISMYLPPINGGTPERRRLWRRGEISAGGAYHLYAGSVESLDNMAKWSRDHWGIAGYSNGLWHGMQLTNTNGYNNIYNGYPTYNPRSRVCALGVIHYCEFSGFSSNKSMISHTSNRAPCKMSFETNGNVNLVLRYGSALSSNANTGSLDVDCRMYPIPN